MKGNVAIHDEMKLLDLGSGVTRRVLAYSQDIMAVEVGFETGAEGAVHSHPHTQCSYVLSGCFSYSIEGEVVELHPGDSIIVSPGAPHGTICLKAGVLLDIFTPMRKDFLKAD